MATNNSVNVPLSGRTGTVNFVGVTSPTFVTPTLGAATATSIAFSPTTNGIIGTTAADDASSGYVGEFISNNATGVALTTNVAANITSISLTAGDWDVFSVIGFTATAGVLITNIECGISTTSATFPDISLVSKLQFSFAAGSSQEITLPNRIININTTTTVYYVALANFTVNTLSAGGFIYARRIR